MTFHKSDSNKTKVNSINKVINLMKNIKNMIKNMGMKLLDINKGNMNHLKIYSLADNTKDRITNQDHIINTNRFNRIIR